MWPLCRPWGPLHEGHLSLLRLARQRADRVIASIFVNPAQFSPDEDFDSYPRQLSQDQERLAQESCDLLYAPQNTDFYPPQFDTSVTVGGVSEGLETAFRPHFFTGVATVVTKLLNQTRPDTIILGEKDYQQYLVIKRLVEDMDMRVDVLGAPIVRDKDELALSSRNVYLSPEERKRAVILPRTLKTCAYALSTGVPPEQALAKARNVLKDGGIEKLDYVEARDAETLRPLPHGALTTQARVLAAVYVGTTRLIDNWPAAPQQGEEGEERKIT